MPWAGAVAVPMAAAGHVLPIRRGYLGTHSTCPVATPTRWNRQLCPAGDRWRGCAGWQAANSTAPQTGAPTAIKHNRQQTPQSIFWMRDLTLTINHSDNAESAILADPARCRAAPRAALGASRAISGVTCLQLSRTCRVVSAPSQTARPQRAQQHQLPAGFVSLTAGPVPSTAGQPREGDRDGWSSPALGFQRIKWP